MNLTSRIILHGASHDRWHSSKFVNDSGFLGAFGQLILIDFFTEGLLDGWPDIYSLRRLVIVPLVFFFACMWSCFNLINIEDWDYKFKDSISLLTTTAIAISIALTFALLFQPGVGIDLALPTAFESTTAPSLKEVLVNIFPTNPIAAMAEGNMLQIIVFLYYLELL